MTPMKAYRHDKSNGDSIQDKYWNPVDCNSVRKKNSVKPSYADSPKPMQHSRQKRKQNRKLTGMFVSSGLALEFLIGVAERRENSVKKEEKERKKPLTVAGNIFS